MNKTNLPKVYLTRRESFCASHRLHSVELSVEQNQTIFGKCNHLNGHGHNYVLEVTLYGAPDPQTGLLLNLTDLKALIQTHILEKVDHRHLNLDVAELKDRNPTTEVLAITFWEMLEPFLPAGILYEIKVFETEKNIASYRGKH